MTKPASSPGRGQGVAERSAITAERSAIIAERRAIVVLGAAVWEGGVPSHALRRRVGHAVELAIAIEHATLLLSGGIGRHPPSEARVMGEVARAAGFPGARILLEESATSTDESARLCATILEREGLGRVTLVTDAYHIERSLLAFRQAGIEAEGAAPPDSPGSLGSQRQRRRERWALRWYRLRGFWRRRSGQLGRPGR